MKVTIDTSLKTIKLEYPENIAELSKQLKEMLGDKWQEYTIVSGDTSYAPYTSIIGCGGAVSNISSPSTLL